MGGFPGGSAGKEHTLPTQETQETLGSIPASGRFPGEGNGNLLQYSCLKNPMDMEAKQTTVHEVTKSQTQLSTTETKVFYIFVVD